VTIEKTLETDKDFRAEASSEEAGIGEESGAGDFADRDEQSVGGGGGDMGGGDMGGVDYDDDNDEASVKYEKFFLLL